MATTLSESDWGLKLGYAGHTRNFQVSQSEQQNSSPSDLSRLNFSHPPHGDRLETVSGLRAAGRSAANEGPLAVEVRSSSQIADVETSPRSIFASARAPAATHSLIAASPSRVVERGRPRCASINQLAAWLTIIDTSQRRAIVSLMANHSTQLDHVFGALSDATRRAIVMRLCEGEASVGELAKPFDMALPSLMKHIRILEGSGLVTSEKTGRVRTCSLQLEALATVEVWLAAQREIWEQRLDRMEMYVEKLKKEEKARARRRKPK